MPYDTAEKVCSVVHPVALLSLWFNIDGLFKELLTKA
jgi:hypothetical protein